ncbi:hypothetical protein DITRI_Ditri09bG0033000 [Diplodiscus trichospermus]
MAGGTEAFPDLGKHCQHSACHQLDFLPFICEGCHKVFCLEHRSYRSHECPNQIIRAGRFQADHGCKQASTAPSAVAKEGWNEKFLAAFVSRNGKDCAKSERRSSPTTPSVNAY